jgi:hypothetical protein
MEGFDPPATTFVKGVGFNSAMEFAERELGRQEMRRRLEELGSEPNEYELHRITNALVPITNALVPLDRAARGWAAAAELHGGTQAELREFFQRMGVHIADSNLRGVYKTLMAFMVSPERLAKLIPSLWKTYFRGLEVKLDLSDLDKGIARTSVVGFGGAPHIGEMAEGWIAYAFDLVGALNVQAYEESLELGRAYPDEQMDYTIRWEVI